MILTEHEIARAQVAIEWVARSGKPVAEIGGRPVRGLDCTALAKELDGCIRSSGEKVYGFIVPDTAPGFCCYGFYKYEWAIKALIEQQAESPPWLLGLLFGYSADAIAGFRCESSGPVSKKLPSRSTFRRVGIYGPLARRARRRSK